MYVLCTYESPCRPPRYLPLRMSIKELADTLRQGIYLSRLAGDRVYLSRCKVSEEIAVLVVCK